MTSGPTVGNRVLLATRWTSAGHAAPDCSDEVNPVDLRTRFEVRQIPTVDDPARAAEAGLPNSFRSVHFDVTLLRADHAPPALERPVGRQAR